MTSCPLSFRVAQAVGFTGSAWLAGNIASLSLITVPALSKSGREDAAPAHILTKQWRHVYHAGKAQNRPVALAAAAAFAYLAWSSRAGAHFFRPGARCSRAGMYCAAALLTLGVVPYTLLGMMGTNAALLRIAEGTGVDARAERDGAGLLDRWSALNAGRSLLPLAGALVGLAAILT